jgi:hypothetical protein
MLDQSLEHMIWFATMFDMEVHAKIIATLHVAPVANTSLSQMWSCLVC